MILCLFVSCKYDVYTGMTVHYVFTIIIYKCFFFLSSELIGEEKRPSKHVTRGLPSLYCEVK